MPLIGVDASDLHLAWSDGPGTWTLGATIRTKVSIVLSLKFPDDRSGSQTDILGAGCRGIQLICDPLPA